MKTLLFTIVSAIFAVAFVNLMPTHGSGVVHPLAIAVAALGFAFSTLGGLITSDGQRFGSVVRAGVSFVLCGVFLTTFLLLMPMHGSVVSHPLLVSMVACGFVFSALLGLTQVEA